MAATATAQINARIDPSLKERGDEALAAAGFSPTQAIRALWQLAARNAGQPQAIEQALRPHGAHAHAEDDAAACQARRLAAAQRGPAIAEQALTAAGLPPKSAPLPELSYEELKELAYGQGSS